MAVQGLAKGLQAACTQVLKSRLPNNGRYVERLVSERTLKDAARTLQRDAAFIGRKLEQGEAVQSGNLLQTYTRYIIELGRKSPTDAAAVVLEDLGLMGRKILAQVKKFVDEILAGGAKATPK